MVLAQSESGEDQMPENKDLYLRYVQALTVKDPAALAAALDAVIAEDFVGHDLPPGSPPGPTPLKEFRRRVHAAFPDTTIVVEDMVEEGDRVAGRNSVTGTHLGEFQGIAPTGQQITFELFDIVRIANGKIAERWGTFDRGGLLERLRAASAHNPVG
jgi:predicted ester cyclase